MPGRNLKELLNKLSVKDIYIKLHFFFCSGWMIFFSPGAISLELFHRWGHNPMQQISKSRLRHGYSYVSSRPTLTLPGSLSILSIPFRQAHSLSVHFSAPPDRIISIPSSPWHHNTISHKRCFHSTSKSPPTAARTALHEGAHRGLFNNHRTASWFLCPFQTRLLSSHAW